MSQTKAKKRILSGVQPSGKLHLGNYLGAITSWVEHQDTSDNLFCVVDLHTLTIPESMTATQRRQKTWELLGLYIACGIDPKKSAIFIQSHVKEHSELAWVLNCVTPLGWLERMTQFKSKAKGQTSISTGLLDYPVLQAADILLYDTDLVPVGEDQKQHIELTSEIARRFNHIFGDTLKVPKVVIKKATARIMGLDDPTAKMSKSVGQAKAGHSIGLLDSEKEVKKTIMSSVTDSGCEFDFDKASPGIQNMLNIYHALTNEHIADISARYAQKGGYGYIKKDLFGLVVDTLKPIQESYHQIKDQSDVLEQIATDGANRARTIAEVTMKKVCTAVGVGAL